jgi:hypothetical protein
VVRHQARRFGAVAAERAAKQTVLFPVRLDDAVLTTDEAWAAKLRDNRNIGDFRRWKEHDAYQKALERLLRDLKVEAGCGDYGRFLRRCSMVAESPSKQPHAARPGT